MKLIKYILFITILMATSNVYGQHVSSYKTLTNNIQIGLFYSYDQNLSSDEITFGPESGFRNEYDQLNFTAGLTAEYYLSDIFVLRSGVSYANRNFRGRYYNNAYAYAGRGPQKEKIGLQFMQIPIAIRFYPYISKISIFGELGLLNQLSVEKPHTYELKGNTYSLSGILGVGAAYNFGRGFLIQVSAKYTNSFSKIFNGADYSYRIFGVQLGLTKKL